MRYFSRVYLVTNLVIIRRGVKLGTVVAGRLGLLVAVGGTVVVVLGAGECWVRPRRERTGLGKDGRVE